MITMVDELFDRHYQAGRDALNASVSGAVFRLAKAVSNAFNVLNRIEYQAPWNARQKRVRCN